MAVHCNMLDAEMQRIAVIGNAGGGKSTLSARLGAALAIPVYSLDTIKWKEGWEPVPSEEVERQCHAWLPGPCWIIDGFGTWEFIATEFERADTIIFLDLPLYLHYWWAIKRQVHDLFRARPDLPPNCPMVRMTIPLLKTIWFTHKLARPKLLELIASAPPGVRVLHLRSGAEINRLCDGAASLRHTTAVERPAHVSMLADPEQHPS